MLTAQHVLFAVEHIVLAYFFVLNATYLAFTVVSFYDLRRYRHRVWRGDLRALLSDSSYLPVSILVPAHNERETVVANVQCLLTATYPEFEVIVINDGSSDDTMDVLKRAFELVEMPPATRVSIATKPVRALYRSLDHPNLIVIDKENGGKSDALNAGINASTYPLFCSIDADSLLESDALLRVARSFAEDDRIIASGGIVRVLNGSVVEEGHVVEVRAPGTPMLLCQSLEYVRGFLAGRTALAKINSLLIISGAFGLFRKAPVVAVGGYQTNTVCEDMELVVRLHRETRRRREHGRVVFVPDPVCWTQIPADWRSLLRQRDRWQRGLIESLWMHRGMMLNPRYGAVGLIGFPFYVLFEALGPVIETAGYVLLPILYLTGNLNGPFAALFLLLAVLFGMVLSVTALILDDLLFRRYGRTRDLVKMIGASLLEYLGFRQLLSARRVLAFVGVLRRKGHWGRIARQAFQQTDRKASPA
ncbi:MAG TPA: glycosyltransferase [Candidatus Binatia bacterium]|nr:glycosyltransferase [Candidatus Binatia bacterium]